MSFSPLASRLKESPISEIFDRAQELRAQGADLCDFSVGEPDFDTPSHISEAGIQAIGDGHTRYTSVDGMPALKDAIIRKFSRDQGLEFERAQIVVGSGAKPVLAAAVALAAGAGDEVILPTPAWPSHLGMIDAAGAEACLVEASFENHYKISPAQLKSAITSKSRLLILSSPSNPTGAVYSEGELLALAEVLRAHPQIRVISDDLYEKIVYDNVAFSTLASVAPDLRDRVLTVNGVSKAYAMTGWRIGYAAGPRDWARAIAGYFSQTEGSPCAISQHAAIAALDGPQDVLRSFLAQYQKRRDVLVAGLAQAEGLKARTPEGAFYVYVDVSGVLGRRRPDGLILQSDQDFANYLLDAGVVVTPGTAFSAPGGMRISIATSEAVIVEGARRIVSAVGTLSSRDESILRPI